MIPLITSKTPGAAGGRACGHGSGAGFTLIEVIVALFVLSVGFLGAFAMLANGALTVFIERGGKPGGATVRQGREAGIEMIETRID